MFHPMNHSLTTAPFEATKSLKLLITPLNKSRTRNTHNEHGMANAQRLTLRVESLHNLAAAHKSIQGNSLEVNGALRI